PGMPGGMPGAPGMPGGMPGAPGMPGGMPGAPGMPGGMPGAPGMPGGMPGAPMGTTLPDTVLTKSREFLWSNEFATAVASQLQSSTDLSLALPFLKLAATMPCKSVRSAAYELFARQEAAGADPLNAQSFFATSVYDPGMLVSLKSLTRPARTKSGDETASLDSWGLARRQMVTAWAGQLRNMSLSPGGKLKSEVRGFPVRAHRGAEFDFVGQMQFGGSEEDIATTRISYARLNFTPKRPKDQETVLKHYESSSAGIQFPDAARQLLWLDGVKTTTSGVRRTIDVLIQPGSVGATTGGGGPPGFGGGEMPGGGMGGGSTYTIEVVVVESEDPGV
ncbi:MAG: collagen-like triple helix repeat-containing protein, partial [Planctomycetaceae bacterium]